jgi:hypothetical protein
VPAAIDDAAFAPELAAKIAGGRLEADGLGLEYRAISAENDLQRRH